VFVLLAAMKRSLIRFGKIRFLVLLGFASISGVKALTSGTQDSPYQAIGERNVFNLHAFLPPVVEAPVKLNSPPKITLTGITTILGNKVAFITIAGVKLGQLPESLMLREGQVVNDVEVKSIDENAGVVQIINRGELQILDFDHNIPAPTAPSAPSAGPVPYGSPPPSPKIRNHVRLTLEEQVALIEVQRIKFQGENNPAQAVLPPTELSSEIIDAPILQ
jgi:hypothetical protein